MADKDEEIARLKARVAQLEGNGACCGSHLSRCPPLSTWRSLSLPAAVESAPARGRYISAPFSSLLRSPVCVDRRRACIQMHRCSGSSLWRCRLP
jgi:hypothetical protein